MSNSTLFLQVSPCSRHQLPQPIRPFTIHKLQDPDDFLLTLIHRKNKDILPSIAPFLIRKTTIFHIIPEHRQTRRPDRNLSLLLILEYLLWMDWKNGENLSKVCYVVG